MSKPGEFYGRDPLFPDNFSSINDFLNKAKSGTLPKFSFIEPDWYEELLGNGTDYHPPGNLGPGESFLFNIYNALSENKEAFKKTLFIINFDEHGGTYDHVTPPLLIKSYYSETIS